MEKGTGEWSSEIPGHDGHRTEDSSQSGSKDALFEQFARVGGALSSPKRLELLDILAQGERTVEALARATGLKLTTASAHLQALHRSGTVARRREGTRTYYRLSGADVARLFASVCDVARAHLADADVAARAYLGEDEVEEISATELLRRINAGDVTVLDVRPGEEYAAAHIKGAVSIPLAELGERLGHLPRNLDIIAYCRGPYCILAYRAIRLLSEAGRRTALLPGGMLKWKLDGHPVETGHVAAGASGS